MLPQSPTCFEWPESSPGPRPGPMSVEIVAYH